jgi:hypothetical protein
MLMFVNIKIVLKGMIELTNVLPLGKVVLQHLFAISLWPYQDVPKK